MASYKYFMGKKNEQFINPNFIRYKTLKEIKDMKKKNTNHDSNED